MPGIPKPKIFPYPKIGKNKFNSTLKNTHFLDKKEVILYSYPGKKPIDVSFGRTEETVTLAHKRIENEYRENNKRLSKNLGKIRTSKASITHTHIFLNGDKHIALPSITDVLTTIEKYNRTRHGYEIIGVVDENKNKRGYTTIKLEIPKIKELKEEMYQNEFNDHIYGSMNKTPSILNKISLSLYGHKIRNKVDLYKLLPELGFEIYFTPAPGYKLDKNFNYVKE